MQYVILPSTSCKHKQHLGGFRSFASIMIIKVAKCTNGTLDHTYQSQNVSIQYFRLGQNTKYIFGFYKWNFACISFKIHQLPAQSLVSQNTQLSSLHERNNADIQIKDGTLLESLQTSFGKCYNLNSSIYQDMLDIH